MRGTGVHHVKRHLRHTPLKRATALFLVRVLFKSDVHRGRKPLFLAPSVIVLAFRRASFCFPIVSNLLALWNMPSWYSEDELDLLRYTPMSPDFRTSYGSYVRPLEVSPGTPRPQSSPPTSGRRRPCRSIPKPTIAFANYEAKKSRSQFVVPNPSSDEPTAVKWLDSSDAFKLLRNDGRLARATKYDRTVASFNLYPATLSDLAINHLIWSVAQKGEYDPTVGNLLLQNNILSLAMPQEFYDFLHEITEEELTHSMLEVLALIAEDEDTEGLSLMKAELEPSIWEDLVQYMDECSAKNQSRMDSKTKAGRKLMIAVESLLRFCYLSPWKIDIYASYITPHEFNKAFQDMQKTMLMSESDQQSHRFSFDRRLVRSNARRPVASLCQTSRLLVSSHTNFSDRNRVFWKLFQDWRRYRKVLVQFLGIPPAQAVQTMVDSISYGTQEDAWKRAETVLACWNFEGNMLSTLPKEVVFNTLAPYVLYASCSAKS
ncbi:hypothetical protein FGB62_47g130 [Gracilaria domingensis]|nr:hypothetical protein FGB62_47g130 [Gracilaria domingensis]